MKKPPICKVLDNPKAIEKFKIAFREGVLNLSPTLNESAKRRINSSIAKDIIVNCIFHDKFCWFSEQSKELNTIGEENYKNIYKIIEDRFSLSIQNDNELLDITKDENYCYWFSFKYTDVFPEEYEIRKLTMQDLISTPVQGEEKYSVLQMYIEETTQLDYENQSKLQDFLRSNKANSALGDIKIEIVFKDIDSYEKYGNVYSRVMYKSECIGIVSRYGKWIDNYSYSTFNKQKWKEMIDLIIKESDIESDQNISVIDPDEDLYDYISLEGISEKTYQ